MFAAYHEDLDFDAHVMRRPRRSGHPFFAALMFLAAYFTTITVQAQQPQDAIVLTEDKDAGIVGTVKEARENYLIVTTAGKDMKVVLDDVNMTGPAETIFTPGMTVTVDGEMKGDDFGVPLMAAKTVTATAPTAPVAAE